MDDHTRKLMATENTYTPTIEQYRWMWTNLYTPTSDAPLQKKTKIDSDQEEHVFIVNNKDIWHEIALERRDDRHLPEIGNNLPDMDKGLTRHVPDRRRSRKAHTVNQKANQVSGKPIGLDNHMPHKHAPPPLR